MSLFDGSPDGMEGAVPEGLKKLFAHLSEGSCDSCGGQHGVENTGTPDELKERYTRFAKKNTFEPGMLVQWKEGLKNKTYPDYGKPVVVVEVLSEPIYDASGEAGAPYWREPLDVICGMMIDSGRFITYYYDSRRFEPYEK